MTPLYLPLVDTTEWWHKPAVNSRLLRQ